MMSDYIYVKKSLDFYRLKSILFVEAIRRVV